jgi:hypothetical protein
MAIVDLHGLIAGFLSPEEIVKGGVTMEAAAVLHSHFYAPGRPGAAIAPTPGVAGAALTAYAGQVPFTNPTGGEFSYLAGFRVAATIAGSFMLLDRLWHNSALVVTTTTPQAVNSVAWPARDQDGAVDGKGVMVGIEVSTATTNAAAITTMTLGYTNSAGVPGRVGTVLPTTGFPATAIAGTFVPFLLDAGDVGVRSIQNVTLATSLLTGVVHLVAYRTLARVDVPLANTGNFIDANTGGLPRLYDNTVPFLVQLPSAVSATNIYAAMVVAQG